MIGTTFQAGKNLMIACLLLSAIFFLIVAAGDRWGDPPDRTDRVFDRYQATRLLRWLTLGGAAVGAALMFVS